MWQAPSFWNFVREIVMSKIMQQVSEAVVEIERVRIQRYNGDVFAAVAELDILIKWRNWATNPARLESDVESRFTGCLKGLCDNSLLDYTDFYHESEEGILRRHR